MKFKISVILLLISIFLIDFPSMAVNHKEIIIAGELNYPPYEYLDDEGIYRGFNVDLMKALSLEMGVEIKQVPMDWVDAHVSLQNGSIDAIQGMNYNEARLELYDFSKEYLINSIACFVRKTEANIFSIDSLKTHKVGVQRSDSAAYALANIGEIELIFYSDLDEAFIKLLNHEIDAVVGNKLTGQYIIQKNLIANNVKIVGSEINYTSYGIAFNKGNEELADEFNNALESIKKQGIYYKIYEKWFGKEIKPAWTGLLNIIYTISFVLLVILVVVILFYRLNRLLKKEVELRTMELFSANNELFQQHIIIDEREKYKEQIINGIGSGLITLDNNGFINTINKSGRNILNIHSEDYIGKQYFEVDLIKYINNDTIRECLESEKHFYFSEKSYIKEGREIIVSSTINPLYNLLNKKIGAVIIFNDVTELNLLRKRLADNDKMNSLGLIVSGISHELRNPLTSIKTYIDMLPLKYDNVKFREKITTQVPLEIARLNNLLTELMDYSKPRKLIKEKFDLLELVVQTLDLFHLDLSKKNIKVNFSDKSKILIFADRQQVKQILINIFINSIDAIQKDGMITIESIILAKRIILIISDDGSGISVENLENIFNPFFTTKPHGSGLGLATCYQFAKQNDAIINITSELGMWTKVDLTFQNIS